MFTDDCVWMILHSVNLCLHRLFSIRVLNIQSKLLIVWVFLNVKIKTAASLNFSRKLKINSVE